MKQASYSELLEKSRIFATMWADQISAEEPSGLQHSIKEEESGHSAEYPAPKVLSFKEVTQFNEVPITESAQVVEDKAPILQGETEGQLGTEAAIGSEDSDTGLDSAQVPADALA